MLSNRLKIKTRSLEIVRRIRTVRVIWRLMYWKKWSKK